jgi:hypothetical protein
MRYLLALLMVAGSVFGDMSTTSAMYRTRGCDTTHIQTYEDTITVCDTVWYYKQVGHWKDGKLVYRGVNVDSIPKIETRDAIITKQKKQVWLTDKEYDKLMELLHPPVGATWLGAAESLLWGSPDSILDDSCGR